MATPTEVHIPKNGQPHVHLSDGTVSEWLGDAPIDGVPYVVKDADVVAAQIRAVTLIVPIKDYR